MTNERLYAVEKLALLAVMLSGQIKLYEEEARLKGESELRLPKSSYAIILEKIDESMEAYNSR